jgi:hypothetical protein
MMLRWCARMVTGAFRYRIWKQTIDAADLLASSPPRYDQYRVAESALKSGACSAIRTLFGESAFICGRSVSAPGISR